MAVVALAPGSAPLPGLSGLLLHPVVIIAAANATAVKIRCFISIPLNVDGVLPLNLIGQPELVCVNPKKSSSCI
jgi:hypothetical protein